MTRLPSIFLTLCAVLATATAIAGPPEVDKAAVIRLGDMVQHVDGIQADGDDLFVQAMATPADDKNKWFISILSMQGCTPCEQLKEAWQTNEWLKSLANPNDPKRSWAHFAIYMREDRSQAFRFKNLQIGGYPTILVQPPLSQKYGDPSTIVFQSTYGGDPERLARQITDAVRRYVSAQGPRSDGVHQSGGGRYEPPWNPSPGPQPYSPPQNQPLSFPDGLPMIPPPSPATGSAGLWMTVGLVVLSMIGTLVLAFAAMIGARSWTAAAERGREQRLAADAERQEMKRLLSEMKANATASSTAAGSRT